MQLTRQGVRNLDARPPLTKRNVPADHRCTHWSPAQLDGETVYLCSLCGVARPELYAVSEGCPRTEAAVFPREKL